MAEIYEIPEVNLSTLRKKINQLNKRASKLEGCSPITIEDHGTVVCVHKKYRKDVDAGLIKAESVPHTVYHKISIVGEGPKLAGWRFLGSLDHHTVPGSVIVKTVPGESVPETYFHTDAVCDHCGKVRYRKDTFVVQHVDTSETKQIGRMCLKDFLGHNPQKVLLLLTAIRQLLTDLSDEESSYYGGGSHNEYVFDKKEILKVTLAIIRETGWIPRSKSGDSLPTADTVLEYFIPPRTNSSEYMRWIEWVKSIVFHEDDDNTVERMLAWLSKQEPKTEYIHNLQILNTQSTISTNMFGFWCSLVAAFQRAEEKLQYAKATQRANECIGNIKDRIDIEVEVISIQSIESYYGVTRLHKMLDNEGRSIVWFANGKSNLEVGHKYLIKATIKKHEEYNNWKQTQVLRVKIIEEL